MGQDETHQATKDLPPSLKEDKRFSGVRLNAPWSRFSRGNMAMQEAFLTMCIADINRNNLSPEQLKFYNDFVVNRSRTHEIYIRETERNKRIGVILSFSLVILSALLMTFAPDGRETFSYWIGAALIIFAAGTAGYGRVWGKAAAISFGADQDQHPLS